MFLHIGGGTAVSTHEILAICALGSDAARAQLAAWEGEGRVIDLAQGREAKAVILTKEKIYTSVLTPATLVRRSRRAPESFGMPPG